MKTCRVRDRFSKAQVSAQDELEALRVLNEAAELCGLAPFTGSPFNQADLPESAPASQYQGVLHECEQTR